MTPARTRVISLLTIFLLLACLPVVAQEPAEPAKEDKKEWAPPRTADGKRLFGATDALRIRGVGGPRLSPDGQWVAYTVSEPEMPGEDKEWKRVTHVWLVPAAGGAAVQMTRGERSATSPEWAPDGKHIAFLTDREKQGERQVWMMRTDGGEAWQVTSHKGGVNDFSLAPDGNSLLLTATDPLSKEEEQRRKVKDDARVVDRDFRMSHLWLWDIEEKEAKRLTEGEFTVSDPQWSPDGAQISYVTRPSPRANDGAWSDIWVLEVASAEKRKLVENKGPDSSARWSPDGKWIAYTGSPEEGPGVNPSYVYVIVAGGGTPRIITQNFDLNPGTPTWSADGSAVYFTTVTRQQVEVFSADVSAGTVRQVSRRGAGTINIADVSRDGSTFVGTMTTTSRPGEVYRADSSFQRIERLTDHNAWLEEYALGAVEVVKWTSSDGTEIEGVLTKPVGFEAGKQYPLLLNPHGGPTGASLASVNATNQVLAANGYLVLQPNFRGSIGRGLEFAAANKNRWGIEDYQDCITGVEALVARGLADRERLGAYGWSYGGYMTFWILTQTDMFKAVSPGAGLSNIYSMYSQNDIPAYLRWFYADAAPWDAFELYWDRSPMKYVKNVKTPTLILHGERDIRVPLAQAQEFYRALEERGVPVEFVVYPRAGHGLTEPRHQLDRIRRYVRFFGKYLDNPPVTEPPEEKKDETTDEHR